MSLSDRLSVSKLDNWLMDAEHQHLIVLMDNVEATIVFGSDEADVRSRFEKLITWAAVHFSHEDDNIRRSGYADGARHIEQHQKLVKSLMGWAEELAHNHDQNQRVRDAICFLEEWLVEHIESEDAKFAAYLTCRSFQ